MLNKKRALTAAILLSCSCLMAPYYAYAATEPTTPIDLDDYNHKSNITNVYVDQGQTHFVALDLYTNKNDPGNNFEHNSNPSSFRSLMDGEINVINNSMQYIKDLLGTPTTAPTIQFLLWSDDETNAGATSDIMTNGKTILANYFDKNAPASLSDEKYAALIEVNKGAERIWEMSRSPVLNNNDTQFNYFATMTHEVFHALGISSISYWVDAEGKATGEPDENHRLIIAEVISANEGDTGFIGKVEDQDAKYIASNYQGHLRDVFGKSPYTVENPTSAEHFRTVKYITLDQYTELQDIEALKTDNNFYIIRNEFIPYEDTSDDDNPSGAIDDKLNSFGGLYFTGANVDKVLNGAKIAWPDFYDQMLDPVPGLPINCYEDDSVASLKEYEANTPELSHVELQNGFMSHQNYRNWGTFMEAELALLQDIGLDIDCNRFFGQSIYNSGASSTNPFRFTINYQNNAYYDGTTNTYNSSQNRAIGTHLYGSYIDANQQGNINVSGEYGVGIRVDGEGNNLTINSNINANGKDANALMVTYGKDHNVTLSQGASLSAIGENGVAARFDFGCNLLGNTVEYRGSYIKVYYNSATDTWENMGTLDAINGELVTNFNVNGTLKGNGAAIYISPNAYVKNINIMSGADIQGNIISQWNPNAIIYQNGNTDDLDDNQILKPSLPYSEDGMTHLNFGCKADENGLLIADNGYRNTISNNIIGKDSFVIDVWAGELATTGNNIVNRVEVARSYGDAPTTYINKGDLSIENNLVVYGNFINENKLQTSFDSEGNSLTISGSDEGKAVLAGNANAQFILNAEQDFYKTQNVINLLQENSVGKPTISLNDENIVVNSNSATLKMSAAYDDVDNTITISTLRDYASLASTSGESQLAEQIAWKAEDILAKLEVDADSENLSPIDQKWQDIILGMDYNDSTGATAKQAMKTLTPHVYSSSAQATLHTHTMLNSLNSMGSFSNNVPAARTAGGRGPAQELTPQHNSWRNIVVPFSSYTDQHNGASSYTNHNSGVLGAMERTLDNGLTQGYHVAVNHQTTSSAGQRIKGEGFYIGTQASYAPADWKGWQVFGSARLGLENMRSHRNLAIAGHSLGTADADWTGYSGSFNVGTALEKEHGIMHSGPFAALGYSFAHRPGVDEQGSGIPAHLGSATYDSLKTQLGYRLTTKPKALDSYDSIKWQVHASVAWNHELLSDNGSTDFALEGLSKAMNDKTADYGRDSMSIAAGVTFKTPKRLDVGLTLGSDIYRKGGSSVYGKVNLEWKF